ncbi:ABC transporter permease [Sediminibacterium sp.]|uniref:ABC transporter permease n=1 Tax=Sediminibacterium sp. TaxID=1917865 RepID=UPI0025DE98BA|nr:ABC transporter permease [Sediminibacterium sp.]MBW0177528.1 ABC transporter permease [Sediminibacterium sp.]
MNFLFAWRYFRSKKSTNAINIIAWISVTAITVGCAALIIILSVFNGFEELVKGLYTDFYTDIRIAPATGKVLKLDAAQLQKIKSVNGIGIVSLVAEEKALLVNGPYQTIVLVKGVDDQYVFTNKINEHIKRGKFSLGSAETPQIVLGYGIENAIGAEVERSLYPLTLYTPNRKAKFNSLDGLSVNNITASGTFQVQQEFDNKYAFTNLAFFRYMLNMDADEYSAVEIKVKEDENKIRQQLQEMLGNNYLVQTRYEQNKSLYAVMQLEKWVIYAILSLILVVAAFNMIGALTMLVLEKQKDIAVLQAMGASQKRIQAIFLTEGLLLAGVGAVLGMLLATLICWIQILFKPIKLAGDTFIVKAYPVKLLPADYLLVLVTVTAIGFIAAWIPSRKASRQELGLK